MDAASVAEPFRFTVDAHVGSSSEPAVEVSLARETRKEIQRLVREISSLCHSRTPQSRFWPKFLGLVGAAMASESGVVWRRHDAAWTAVAQVGQIDSRILLSPGPAHSCHDRLIAEVGDTAGAVIVPPGTPWEIDEPGNPTELLAALVPVPVDPDEPVQWIVEQFLPTGGGPATLRGYLRFIAQMTDLAAEYLRAERMREYRQRAEWSARLETLLADLYECDSVADAQRKLVNTVSDLMEAERVSLVSGAGDRFRVLAISGVSEIDRLSPAVASIAAVAESVASSPGFHSTADSSTVVTEDHPQAPSMDSGEQSVVAGGELIVRGVAVLDGTGARRLVVEDDPASASPLDNASHWPILLRHLNLVLDQHERIARGRLFGSWSSATKTQRRGRRALMWAGVAAVFFLVGWMPFPLVVTAEGRLEPLETQTVFAPHDGIISDLRVQHGSRVRAGDPLLQLFDARLEQNLHSMASRRASLQEKIRELERQLARDGSKDRQQAERLQAQVNLTSDELAGVDGELEILRAQEAAMLVRSTRDGIVDAWQAGERLENRPVNRGQALLRVIAPEGGWQVQADIPQNRLQAVLAARQRGPVEAEVVVESFPEQSVSARLTDMGPVVQTTPETDVYGIAQFAVDEAALPIKQAGTPISIAIECGSRSLGYVAFQDAIRLAQRTIRLYW